MAVGMSQILVALPSTLRYCLIISAATPGATGIVYLIRFGITLAVSLYRK